MPSDARIWVYQSDRRFTESEVAEIKNLTKTFIEAWTAHDKQLRASFEIRHNCFIILAVDEKEAGASGCSIDKSLNHIKKLEALFSLSLLNRLNVAYRSGGRIELCSMDNFRTLLSKGSVKPETPVFNNLVSTVAELNTAWELPLEKSWHASLI